MLAPYIAGELDRWTGKCDGCLTSVPAPYVFAGSRDEVLAALVALGWEPRPPDMVWCPRCSSEKRAPRFPLGARGRERKRRW